MMKLQLLQLKRARVVRQLAAVMACYSTRPRPLLPPHPPPLRLLRVPEEA